MKPVNISGNNFSYDGETIKFFGVSGYYFGDKWAIRGIEVSPCSIISDIRACVAGDKENGNDGMIAQLQLNPDNAVVFFLEGGITAEQLIAATEGDGYVDIPNVTILSRRAFGITVGGYKVTVRVLSDPEHVIATATATGSVL